VPAQKTYAVAMPRRSTPFQAIVHLVRQHYAESGVTVTESKFLHDPVVGEREVDIVVEAEADGDPVVISLEVNQKGRPASVEWVEQISPGSSPRSSPWQPSVKSGASRGSSAAGCASRPQRLEAAG
jgi:hypothetical protein